MKCECNDIKCIHNKKDTDCEREAYYNVKTKDGIKKMCRMCSFDSYGTKRNDVLPERIRR